ncbi:hypothetical protein D3C78_644100 [compost metagenome]
MLGLAARVALLAQRAGLPAEAAQGVALVFGQVVPLVARGVPELVEQAVPRRHQPGQGLRLQRDTFAGHGEGLFHREEAQRCARRLVQPGQTAAERCAAAVVQPGAPDLVEQGGALIGCRIAVLGQAPAHAGLLAAGEVAQHLERLAVRGAQHATNGTAGSGHVEQQLALAAQAGQLGIHQAEAPAAAQAVAEVAFAGFRQGQAGFVRSQPGRLLAFPFLVPGVDSRGYNHCGGGRHSRHEASSGEAHNLSSILVSRALSRQGRAVAGEIYRA